MMGKPCTSALLPGVMTAQPAHAANAARVRERLFRDGDFADMRRMPRARAREECHTSLKARFAARVARARRESCPDNHLRVRAWPVEFDRPSAWPYAHCPHLGECAAFT